MTKPKRPPLRERWDELFLHLAETTWNFDPKRDALLDALSALHDPGLDRIVYHMRRVGAERRRAVRRPRGAPPNPAKHEKLRTEAMARKLKIESFARQIVAAAEGGAPPPLLRGDPDFIWIVKEFRQDKKDRRRRPRPYATMFLLKREGKLSSRSDAEDELGRLRRAIKAKKLGD